MRQMDLSHYDLHLPLRTLGQSGLAGRPVHFTKKTAPRHQALGGAAVGVLVLPGAGMRS